MPVWGFRQSIYEPAGNFYTSVGGEKGCKTQKSGVPSLKNQVKTPIRFADISENGDDSNGSTIFFENGKKPANPHDY